jgi:thiamine biosynthesis lipoprotein
MVPSAPPRQYPGAVLDGHSRGIDMGLERIPGRGSRLWGVAAALVLVFPGAAASDWQVRDAEAMGTAIRVEVWHERASEARAAIEAVLAEIDRIERLMSTYREDSELSRINRTAAEGPVPIGAELADLIARSLEFSDLTEGAFDVTYASVGHLYDYRKGVKPSTERIEEALPAVDYRHLRLDRERLRIEYSREGVVVNLGGIAKGYAIERAAGLLRERGIRHALVNAGGDTRFLGDRRGRPWLVGVRHPDDPRGIVTRIPVADEAVSTSGDYERFFDLDGERYHHIINPSTGTSARDVRSVTVIGPDATTTDALSTSVFVLGPERGLALIDRLPGIEAIIVDREGRLQYSQGLQALSPSPSR